MRYSEGSLLRQYERAFRAYGIEISFEDEALRLLAESAATEKTGARGLLTVFEQLFRDYKYYLAGSGLSQLRVTARSCASHGGCSTGSWRRVISWRETLEIRRSQFAEKFRSQHGL